MQFSESGELFVTHGQSLTPRARLTNNHPRFLHIACAEVTKSRPAVECATRFIAVPILRDDSVRADFIHLAFCRSALQP
jgi:hypothetical protein